eukprot:TRINITY_DN9322_c0_g2_i2.p1 TRINITY_DN9322_c0_g2~~TRINITY_DN9322_c0_g2_i2.p1  ORF type:complete len:113 (+),score=33.42 TRINITY_DN9322_c0_g2_i2:64-402(+)
MCIRDSSKVIKDILNDPYMDEMIHKSTKLPIQLYGTFDESPPASLESISPGIDKNYKRKRWDHKDHRYLFLEDEFTSLIDLVFENTFFNIIREATHKEIDLTKISKTYLKKT